MSYLLDKKIKRNIFFRYTILVVILVIFIFFGSTIFSGFSYVSSIVLKPVLVLGNNIGSSLSNVNSYFSSKKSLLLENENLKNQILQSEADRANYALVVDENMKMKEILDRKDVKSSMILASILSRPNQSPYDTLVIDIGARDGISVGQKVFALGNVPVGYIGMTYPNSSKVTLFSNPGEKTEVVVAGKNVFMEVVGRGNGNFEMILPRDFVLEKGTEVSLSGITSHVLGVVQTIVSDPRDSFQKALLISPVNIQELKFVEIEK